jgi:hypothetical protein
MTIQICCTCGQSCEDPADIEAVTVTGECDLCALLYGQLNN